MIGVVKEVVKETPSVSLIRISLSESFSFVPGQWVLVSSDDFCDENNKPVRRAFSVASLQSDDYLELCVSRGKNFSVFLQDLSPGAKLNISGPFGKFKLESFDNHLFIAGGTGIAPFRSMIHQALERKNKVTLLFSMKTPSDFVYRKYFESLDSNFRLVPTITSDNGFPAWKGERGRIQSLLKKYWKNGVACYLCGPPGMVESVTEELINLGQPKENIFVDKWE